MGVYIKGLEMLTNCDKCIYSAWSNFYQIYVCNAVMKNEPVLFEDKPTNSTAVARSTRADNCPLVHVPPHGRLGDLDRLERMFADISIMRRGGRVMDRLTQHSKTTMFTDSDVMVEGQRLGPAAFEGLSYYRHYVKIINRLAELEDRFCNEPQTRADRIRAMTNEELAEFFVNTTFCDSCFIFKNECGTERYSCKQRWLDWLKQEVDDG